MTSKFKALKFSTEQRKLRKTDIPNKFEWTVRLQKSLKKFVSMVTRNNWMLDFVTIVCWQTKILLTLNFKININLLMLVLKFYENSVTNGFINWKKIIPNKIKDERMSHDSI